MQEEQPTGAVVGAFTATDADSNIAGYAIDPPSPYFNIDNITGKLFTSKIPVSISRKPVLRKASSKTNLQRFDILLK